MLVAACNLLTGSGGDDDGDWEGSAPTAAGEVVLAPSQQDEPEGATPAQIPDYAAGDKWSLWVDGPHLRGANIWQSIVIPDLDGLEFKGPGPVGPPFTQEDFDRLAMLGANYVAISGPGLFTEKPPFEVDQGAVINLDNLLTMIAKADMFATIGFRTGPGRSEYGLCCDGDWYFKNYFNDTMWENQDAQNAWVEMWRYTAERYTENPIVAGYKLMVEPNSNGVFFGGIYEPEEFYSQYAGTLYDWNQLYPRLVEGIREVDPETPILIGGMGWSAVNWLPYLEPVDDPHVVYVVHQYEPQENYTHQELSGMNSYPGELDLDYDNRDDAFNREWLDDLLLPIDTFMTAHNVPVSVDEFGVNRWVPGAAQYLNDEISLFEQRGLNYALWEWQTSWAHFANDVHDMNFLLGPDPDNLTPVENDLKNVIVGYWSLNTVRPSFFATSAEDASSALSVEPHSAQGGAWWKPGLDTTWQWQLEGIIDTSYDVDMYDVDMFETSANQVRALQDDGRAVICYINVGSWENWRSDASQFSEEIIGKKYDGWPGEQWLDIRRIDLLAPIILARFDECIAKGFDGIEPDNMDAYSNDTGFPLTYADQLDYNIWLAEEAHARGLSIGLKNDPDQVTDLLPYFDWALTEDCFAENWCEEMLPFIESGKPVFAAEYTDMNIAFEEFCVQAEAWNFSGIFKNRELDAYLESCG